MRRLVLRTGEPENGIAFPQQNHANIFLFTKRNIFRNLFDYIIGIGDIRLKNFLIASLFYLENLIFSKTHARPYAGKPSKGDIMKNQRTKHNAFTI